MFLNYNGTICLSSEKILTSSNRSFRFGDGLFETIHLFNGEILFLEDHIMRMMDGMKILHINIPEHYSFFFFHKSIVNLLHKNKITSNARIRINIFRSGDGLYHALNHDPEYLIECSPLNDNQFLSERKNISLGVFENEKKTLTPLSSVKSNSSLVYILAANYCDKNNFNDCVILNTEGRIAEAISSNIFLIKAGTLATPSLQEGCVVGVMRKKLKEFLKKNNFSVNETQITINDAMEADEIFLTNVISGIRGVTTFKSKNYNNKITAEISDLFLKELSDSSA